MAKYKEKTMEVVFLVAACVSILAVALICIFLFANGVPAMKEIGFADFLLGREWRPGNDIYGIFPMIIGSIYVTAGAIVIGVPIGLLTAVFLAKYCPAGIYKVVKPGVELLAGIPSVVYGFFGMVVIVPFIRNNFGGGNSILAASILLGMMILPTIISQSEASIRAVPESYYEGSLALGATHERSVFCAVLPAAKSGILAGIILAIFFFDDTAAAEIYTAGTVAQVPTSVFGSGRTLAVHMYNLSSEGLYMDQAYATAVILLVLVVGINALSSVIARKLTKA